jgi:hypothetical protein
MTDQEQIAQLKATIARLEAAKAAKQVLSFRVSEKKALSVYGLGRFPVTLYKSQWKRLLAEVDNIKALLDLYDGELAEKE